MRPTPPQPTTSPASFFISQLKSDITRHSTRTNLAFIDHVQTSRHMDTAMLHSSECYMCDRPSSSMEHVPPKCLFPETKDLGRQYRNNLITVPSCDEHNSHKSADDEFLMASLAGLIGNNSVGLRHKFTKVNRAIYRSKFALLDQAMSGQRWEYLKVGPHQYVDVLWGKPNYDRLNTCFDRIARTLLCLLFAEILRKHKSDSSVRW